MSVFTPSPVTLGDAMTTRLNVYAFVSFEGTVSVFAGEDDDGKAQLFAVESRYALGILHALDGDDDVVVELEDWQLVGVRFDADEVEDERVEVTL